LSSSQDTYCMAHTKEVVQTGMVTVTFLGILLGLGLFQSMDILPVEFDSSELIVIAIVPFLSFLAITGRLKKFSGGGFEVVLQAQARKFVSPNASKKIEIDPELLNPKSGLAELEEIKRRSPTVLTFELEREHFYDEGVVREFLESLETLRYIVFTDREGRFSGYSRPTKFLQLMDNHLVDVIEELENGNILNRSIVRTVSIRGDSTNVECLRAMNDHQISELAIVNSEGKFTGVITQDSIIRKLVLSAISEI
jgi:CBS domain-containing protein